jgi:Dyp-type peroxidase family
MSKLNPTDLQGFVVRGYNMPYARYCFLHFQDPKRTCELLGKLLPIVTTGQLWDEKPKSTVNIAFTFQGLAALHLPLATLNTFPVEFQQGMKARGRILGDTGLNSAEHWEELWLDGHVHAWLGINGLSPEDVTAQFDAINAVIAESGGAHCLGFQDAASLFENGAFTAKEHFGYTDGFGNPDYVDICRKTQPGQGKLDKDGNWTPLATGELLLGYADEAGELPVAPVPHLLASNGTFMVYRKLHQNVGAFRAFLNKWSSYYGAGDNFAREKLASKFIGRWRDGTPIEKSPDAPNPGIVADANQNTDFKYGGDSIGARCPFGAHIRRVHPRDSFGFDGRLINRRRITRRGLPYGPIAPTEGAITTSEEAVHLDAVDRGVIFMALNANLARQFEFVQQQWIAYGNDAHLGNEKDLLMGSHGEGEKFVIQGDTTRSNPPFVCSSLPNFVELRGGEYFFVPSITALGMISKELVDPR